MDNLIDGHPVEYIDAATTEFLSFRKRNALDYRELTAVNIGASFLKGCANVKTLKLKGGNIAAETVQNEEFFAKMAMNSIIEFNRAEQI